MTPANKLIDKAKEMCEGRSYAALARRLVVTPQTVHQWKNGDVPLPTERIVEIAKIAHLPVDEWVLRVLSDQSKGEARRVLEGVMKKIGYAAAIALCAMGLSIGGTPKALAHKGLLAAENAAATEQCLLCKLELGMVGAAGALVVGTPKAAPPISPPPSALPASSSHPGCTAGARP